jgi:hypothetical protein
MVRPRRLRRSGRDLEEENGRSIFEATKELNHWFWPWFDSLGRSLLIARSELEHT